MTANEQLINRLYTGFQNKDHAQMAVCYHDDATFRDGAFDLKNGREVRAMWHYLITNGKDLRLEFNNVRADDSKGFAHWEAWYTFSRTGKKVHNIIDAEFEFKDGLIIRQTDTFDFWRWSKQALGLPGHLLGWSSFLQNKVKETARGGLEQFISQHPEYR